MPADSWWSLSSQVATGGAAGGQFPAMAGRACGGGGAIGSGGASYDGELRGPLCHLLQTLSGDGVGVLRDDEATYMTMRSTCAATAADTWLLVYAGLLTHKYRPSGDGQILRSLEENANTSRQVELYLLCVGIHILLSKRRISPQNIQCAIL